MTQLLLSSVGATIKPEQNQLGNMMTNTTVRCYFFGCYAVYTVLHTCIEKYTHTHTCMCIYI